MKEMRLMQIIGDIDEKYIDEAAPAEQKKKAMRFTPWIRYASIAACAMLVIGVGIFAITQHSGNIIDTPAQSEEADSSDFLQSGNPYAEYDTLEEAENTIGFEISVPDSYGGYTEPYYAVIEGKILEVQYYNGDDRGMIISKSRGSEDISGDFNEYNTVTETEVNGNTVTIKGNGDEFSLALWVSGDYSYSVSVSSGISENALKEIIEKIK